MTHRFSVAAAVVLAFVPAAHGQSPEAEKRSPVQSVPKEQLPSGNATFVQPNVRLPNGQLGYAHLTPNDMPWRIAISMPKSPPKYGSSTKAREVAIEAIRMWEAAIQPLLPWFKLEFVDHDPEAAVQVDWKRRIAGPWAGFGWMDYQERDGKPWIGGHMEVSTTPDNFTTLTIDEVRLVVAHEFGHVLGLGHCLDCDSAMNYSWSTRGRVLVTDLDARTFLELTQIPVGADVEKRKGG